MARKTDGMTPQQLKAVPRGLESSFASWKYTDDEELFTIFKWLVVMYIVLMQYGIIYFFAQMHILTRLFLNLTDGKHLTFAFLMLVYIHTYIHTYI
jgi:hypothetical protein